MIGKHPFAGQGCSILQGLDKVLQVVNLLRRKVEHEVQLMSEMDAKDALCQLHHEIRVIVVGA
jgi:hypothetical protein